MNKISILIAVPCYGGQLTSETTTGLFLLAKHLERINLFNELLLVANQSLIPQARASIANIFINDTNHTHLLMLDADVGFVPEDVIKLLELEVDFAVGAYPLKTKELQYNFKASSKEFNDTNTALSIDTIGAGFCLVTRRVFTDVANKYPELQYIPVDKSINYNVSDKRRSNSFSYFETYIDENRYQVSEDFAFNKRWISTGGKIWLHTGINLTHTGSHTFHGIDLSNLK